MIPIRILITGANGQLGRELFRVIKNGYCELGRVSSSISAGQVICANKEELDISSLDQVRKYLNKHIPEVVINSAASTNVDKCENNVDNVYKNNAIGARNLAIVCEEIGAKLVHISTDYVFSGEVRDIPYREYDLTNPQNVYGYTKLSGEKFVCNFCNKHFVVRTSWLYGYEGINFVYTIRKIAKENGYIKVVNDQVGNPTNATDLAYHILKLIETDEYGIYHCSGNGICSWYDFAKEIVELSKIECIVEPCLSEEFKRDAKRPKFSALDNMMLRLTVGDEMRSWQEALKSFIDNLNENRG